jgi:hypothetical protein
MKMMTSGLRSLSCSTCAVTSVELALYGMRIATGTPAFFASSTMASATEVP